MLAGPAAGTGWCEGGGFRFCSSAAQDMQGGGKGGGQGHTHTHTQDLPFSNLPFQMCQTFVDQLALCRGKKTWIGGI